MAWSSSTERLARASARRPWRTIGAWALLLVASGSIISRLLAGALTTEFDFTNDPEAKRGEELVEKRLRGPERVQEILIVRSGTHTVADPEFRAAVEKLRERVSALGTHVVQGAASYYMTRDESLVSRDGDTTLLPIVMAGTVDDASENIDRVIEIARESTGREFEVFVAGQASLGNDFNEIAERDLRVGEGFGVLVALVVLVGVFGAVAAGIIPIVLAVASIVVALGATALVGQLFDLSFFVTNMISMMGLAVGIDYSLFVVSRYREERRRGREKVDAIATAGGTASRAVFFSGMTVVLALVGMLIVPTTIFRALATGAILVVLAAVAASLTLLPAVLGVMGDRVNSLRIPFLARRPGDDPDPRGGFWDRVAHGVMRRPVISLVLGAGLLLAAAASYFSIETGFSGVSTLSDERESKRAFNVLAAEFSGGQASPAEVVIDGEASSTGVRRGIERLQAALRSDRAFGPGRLAVNEAGDLAVLSVPLAGDPQGRDAIDAIRRLRDRYIPRAFSGIRAEVLVTGDTAFSTDFFDINDRYTPIVFVFVLGLSFLLLTVVFRSLVVPLKAILMNLLSVGAAYGLIVLVFQKGVGADLLGFQQVEVIEAWLPLFLFSILFGLSMDYHVFLLSRIRERFDHTHNNGEAVAFGLRTTAGIITGAALIMVAVFSGFAAGELVMFQQMGFGLAVAVFLDATIVRSVLVPASMKLLGDRNWYLPRWLRWLPQVKVERSPASGDGEVGRARNADGAPARPDVTAIEGVAPLLVTSPEQSTGDGARDEGGGVASRTQPTASQQRDPQYNE